MNTLRLFLRLSRPPLLLIAAVLYFLGVGAARYLGATIDWELYWLGQAWLILVQFVIHALNEYFEGAEEQRNPSKNLIVGSSGVLELGKLPRAAALWSSVACAMAAGWLSILLIRDSQGSIESLVILLVMAVAGLAYSIPPLRLSATGYGELVLSFFITALVPVLAFTLQMGEMHRVLTMITFPLVCFFLSLVLILEFPTYATDMKYGRQCLLLRLGWQRGISLHHLLVLGGFLLLGLAVLWGLPWKIAIPLAAVLPIGLFQVWYLNRIGQGVKPNWTILTTVAVATFGLTIYFLTYGLWTH